MKKHLLIIFCIVFSLLNKINAQCPQLYDSDGNLSNAPFFKNCTGGAYAMNLQSPSNFPAYTINWGDGSPNTVGASYAANSNIPHTYASTIGTFTITLSIPLSACTRTMRVTMEQAAVATISLTSIGSTQCAPKTFTFINITNNQTASTTYTWSWGDGSPIQVFNAANNPSVITHTFQKHTVQNCQTTVFLYANNTCNFVPSFDQKGPFQIYDTDPAAVTPDAVTKCWPQNTFTYNNTTLRQCLAQGNNGQRYEYWNLGDHWGLGRDSIVNWKTWPPTTPVSVSYPAIGSYTVMLVDSNACGVDAVVQTVNIVNPPNAGVIGPTVNICQNTSITFTNTSDPGYTYNWNFGTNSAFTNIGSGNKSVSYATPGTYTVRVIALVAGSTSCRDTASAVVNIIAAPVANFSYAPATGCSSIGGVTFTNSSVGANTSTWTLGNGNTFIGTTPPPQNYIIAGVSTISLMVTSITGCVHTKTGAVTVYSKPVPNFPTFANCVNSVSNFSSSSTVSGNAAINSYTWNFGDNTPKTNSQNPSHTYTLAGVYTVTLAVETPFCKDSIVKNITVNLRPVANFVFTPTINCPPFVSSFSNTTVNGVNYLWRFGTAATATSNITSPTFTYNNSTQNIATYTVTLVSTTGAGCADSIKNTISVYPKPVANFTTNALSGCSPIAVNFTNTSLGINTYSWNYGDGAASTQTNTSHTYTNLTLISQTRTVQLYATNDVGCKDTIEHTIQVFPEPLSTFTLTPGSGCDPLAVNFQSALGAISYTWDYGDGSGISNATNPPHTFTNNALTDKSYTINLATTNAFGCMGATSGVATVFAKPTAGFVHTPNAGCSPLVVTFTNTSQLNSTNSWTLGNGQTSQGADPGTTYTNAPGDASIIYNVNLTVKSANGCEASISNIVKVYGQPKSQFLVDTPACAPKVITFTNTSVSANSYLWDFGDASPQLTVIGPSHLYTNNSQFNATYQVKLTTQSNDGCSHTAIVPIIIHPKPTFFVISAPDSGCSPLKVVFSKVVGAVKYSWDFYKDPSIPKTVTTNSIATTFLNNTGFDKEFNIDMIAEDGYGCSDTASKVVKVFPNPTAKFTAAPLSVFIPNQTTYFGNSSLLATNFVWDFGDGSTSTEKAPNHTYQKAGEYEIKLTVTTNRGCKDVYVLPEKVKALDETDVQMPNAFTPNAAGSPGSVYDPNSKDNDVFHPVIRGAEKYNLSIFSRWGELLFDTKDPNEGWDGYYKGKLCTQDVYIWKLAATFVDGKAYNKTGDVLLLR